MNSIDCGFKIIPEYSLSAKKFENYFSLQKKDLAHVIQKESITSVFCENFDIASECKKEMEHYLKDKIKEIDGKYNRTDRCYKTYLKSDLQQLAHKNKIKNLLKSIYNDQNYDNEKEYNNCISDLVKVEPVNENVTLTTSFWNKYNSLWNEYKYRHDLIWKLSFRATAICVVVSILPYTEKKILGSLSPLILILLLSIPIGIIAYSIFIIKREIKLLDGIKTEYRSIQKKYLKIDQGSSGFEGKIRFLFYSILLLTLINFLYALFR